LIKLIIRTFIKDHQNVTDKYVRESYGVLAGILGIICNLFLFILKLSIGIFINSIAVISDAFNNLTDLGSSLISIIGAKLSNRPPDHGHPYGHGRFEYVSSLVVSFIIFTVGLQLLRSSFDKLFNPADVLFSPVSLVILVLSVLIKFWMFSYNLYIGKTINSSINRATAFDSINDTIATSAVIVTTIIAQFVDFPLDGLVGIIISLLILYTGFSIAKDTVNLLLGSTPDPELVSRINTMVLNGNFIVGTHDLKVHDYGPGRVIASIRAEVPDYVNLVEVHSVIDELELKIAHELGISMVIHMDPISTNYEHNKQVIQPIQDIIQSINPNILLDNARIADVEHRVNVIFDLIIPHSIDTSQHQVIKDQIVQKVKDLNPSLHLVITPIKNKIIEHK
jgi:cation diffusion facilitator family transporter